MKNARKCKVWRFFTILGQCSIDWDWEIKNKIIALKIVLENHGVENYPRNYRSIDICWNWLFKIKMKYQRFSWLFDLIILINNCKSGDDSDDENWPRKFSVIWIFSGSTDLGGFKDFLDIQWIKDGLNHWTSTTWIGSE